MTEDKNDSLEKSDDHNRGKKGPHGLGDPDDKSLRKVEKDVLIPKKMRWIAHEEKCVEQFADFRKCVKATNFSMIFKCRSENSVLKSCLEKWYFDEEFKERCTLEYLEERSEFRRTGIRGKDKKRLEASGL